MVRHRHKSTHPPPDSGSSFSSLRDEPMDAIEEEASSPWSADWSWMLRAAPLLLLVVLIALAAHLVSYVWNEDESQSLLTELLTQWRTWGSVIHLIPGHHAPSPFPSPSPSDRGLIRGLTAANDVTTDDLLLRIPANLTFSYRSIHPHIQACEAFSGPLRCSNVESLLMGFLHAHHQWHTGDDPDANQRFAAWFATLPSLADIHSALSFLSLSADLERVANMTDDSLFSVARNLTSRIPVIAGERLGHLVDGAAVTEERIVWAYALLRSRVHWLGEEGYAFMPVIDLLNHHYDHNVVFSAAIEESEMGYFDVRATRPIQQGDPVFISYGEFSNLRLLLTYGFTLADNPVGPFLPVDLTRPPFDHPAPSPAPPPCLTHDSFDQPGIIYRGDDPHADTAVGCLVDAMGAAEGDTGDKRGKAASYLRGLCSERLSAWWSLSSTVIASLSDPSATSEGSNGVSDGYRWFIDTLVRCVDEEMSLLDKCVQGRGRGVT